MKFYNGTGNIYYWKLICDQKLTANYCNSISVTFYKNGQLHNAKNAAYIAFNGCKQFILNNKHYGTNYTFTKESWRKFIKLKAFL
jgi:hypothetical protein